VIDPDHPENPFEPKVRFRNYLIIRLRLDLGIAAANYSASALKTAGSCPTEQSPFIGGRTIPTIPARCSRSRRQMRAFCPERPVDRSTVRMDRASSADRLPGREGTRF
jgi:hypothetical protein